MRSCIVTKQGDKEKELKIPVTKMMDRETAKNYAANQLGFTDFVLTPLFQALCKFLPSNVAHFSTHHQM